MKNRHFQRVGFFIAMFSALLTCPAAGQNPTARMSKNNAENPNLVRGELGATLDEYMRRLEGFGFSGALLVAKDDRVFLAKGYGLADRERSIPVSSDTAFYSASIAKQFTAAAVMLLEQQGKLRVEDAITVYFDNV